MSELSRDEALVAAAVLAVRNTGETGTRSHAEAIEDARWALSQDTIRTALAGGGGGEKPCDAGLCERHGCKVYSGPPDCPTCGAPVCCQFCCYEAGLESRLAAAEKRAEEAERSVQVWKDCNETSERERDAALARVKELEDAMGRIHDVWMATDVNALNLALANMDIPTRVTT